MIDPIGRIILKTNYIKHNRNRETIPAIAFHRNDWAWTHEPLSNKKTFCECVVFEREKSADQSHGPERFSLMYLCAEGNAAYQILFIANQIRPRVMCIIQPSTQFDNPNYTLAQSVIANPAGMSPFLLNGQCSKRTRHDSACWAYYDTFICLLHKSNFGNISLFSSSIT